MRADGYSLIEAIAALAIFGMAVVVAANFLGVHMSASRRLETRADLVRASEVVLESLRGEAMPLISGKVDIVEDFPPQSSAHIETQVQVSEKFLPGLYEVQVEARALVRSEEMVVIITTQVWRP